MYGEKFRGIFRLFRPASLPIHFFGPPKIIFLTQNFSKPIRSRYVLGVLGHCLGWCGWAGVGWGGLEIDFSFLGL